MGSVKVTAEGPRNPASSVSAVAPTMPKIANWWFRCQIPGPYFCTGCLAGFPVRRLGLVAVIDSCLLTSESLEHAGHTTGVLQILESGLYQATGRERARHIAQLGSPVQLCTEIGACGAMV